MEDGWVEVGARIHAERARRWRTRKDFAQATGLSVRVLLDLETGSRSRYRPSTLSAVETALGWTSGSIERAAQGRRPERETDRELQRILDAWPYLTPETKATLVMIAEQSRRI